MQLLSSSSLTSAPMIVPRLLLRLSCAKISWTLIREHLALLPLVPSKLSLLLCPLRLKHRMPPTKTCSAACLCLVLDNPPINNNKDALNSPKNANIITISLIST